MPDLDEARFRLRDAELADGTGVEANQAVREAEEHVRELEREMVDLIRREATFEAQNKVRRGNHDEGITRESRGNHEGAPGG